MEPTDRQPAVPGTKAWVAFHRKKIYDWLAKENFLVTPSRHRQLRVMLKELQTAAVNKTIVEADAARKERDIIKTELRDLQHDFQTLLTKRGYKNRQEANLKAKVCSTCHGTKEVRGRGHGAPCPNCSEEVL